MYAGQTDERGGLHRVFTLKVSYLCPPPPLIDSGGKKCEVAASTGDTQTGDWVIPLTKLLFKNASHNCHIHTPVPPRAHLNTLHTNTGPSSHSFPTYRKINKFHGGITPTPTRAET